MEKDVWSGGLKYNRSLNRDVRRMEYWCLSYAVHMVVNLSVCFSIVC